MNLPAPPPWLEISARVFFWVTYVGAAAFLVVFFLVEDVRVIDGDTFEVCGAGKCTTYHVWGVNAPELRTPRCEHEKVLAERSRDNLVRILRRGYEIVKTHGETHGEPWVTVKTEDGFSFADLIKGSGHGLSYDEDDWCGGIERMATR